MADGKRCMAICDSEVAFSEVQGQGSGQPVSASPCPWSALAGETVVYLIMHHLLHSGSREPIEP